MALVVAVVMTIAACTSGVDKGIRLVSELNLWCAAAMLLYILATGRPRLCSTRPWRTSAGSSTHCQSAPLQTFAYEPGGSNWMAVWTLFFWAHLGFLAYSREHSTASVLTPPVDAAGPAAAGPAAGLPRRGRRPVGRHRPTTTADGTARQLPAPGVAQLAGGAAIAWLGDSLVMDRWFLR